MVKPKRSAGSAPRATDFVESLDRGLRLLQVFAARPSPMTLSEIAAAADLPRATARRILFTLAARRLCHQRRQAVRADAACADAGGRLFAPNQVVAVLQPVLDAIAVAAQEISLARRARRRRRRVHRARQPDADFFRRRRDRLSPAVVLHGGRPRDSRPVWRCRVEDEACGDEARGADAADGSPIRNVCCGASPPTAAAAIPWSIARPSRISAPSRCRSAAMTARSSPPSISAPMSIASRPRRW